jgi:N-acetylneuraminic acid mutarotase
MVAREFFFRAMMRRWCLFRPMSNQRAESSRHAHWGWICPGRPLILLSLALISVEVTAQEPSARHNHTAVWTGTEMIVWGGRGAGGVLNTGGRYHPATRTWTAMSTTGAPAARENHVAVWTGTEMIVWGGLFDPFTSFNDGARYNPATDTWSPLTTTGAPLGRAYHTGIWTGTHFIPWGGVSNNPGAGEFYYNSGGRFSPVTNSWAVIPTTNAPIARSDHSAVWANDRMIIWGGLAQELGALEPLKTNTGGIYNPSSDSWAATSTANAPTVRATHTAVWTGSRMIVWGGVGLITATDIYNTGGRYDPAADSWAATSTGANVPSVRQNHTAVWTGTEMIVWGGQGSIGNFRDSGGRYNPNTDTWAAMATGPAARAYHTAVWAGSEMIIWGGYGFGGDLQGLGRYRPAENTWNTAPLCEVTSPGAGARMGLDVPLALAASASDPGGSVSQVEFRVNDSPVGTDSSSPYTVNWQPAALGAYTLSAVATDGGGLKATSAPVAFEIVLQPKLTPNWLTNRLGLTLMGETNRAYVVEVSSNLLQWLPFQTNLATNGTFTVEDTSVTNGAPRRYYRALP